MDMEKSLTIVEIRIKFLRDLKGLTQEKLAKELNVSRSLINNIENGYANVSLKLLITLSYYYKVPIDYILGLITDFDRSIYEFKKDIDLEYLGKKIRLIRKIEDLKQEQFASKLHINRSCISYYESGKVMMSSSQLKDICNTFGYSADWCLGTTLECIRRNTKIKLSKEEIKEVINI